MNWVGGARSRVRAQNERKLQKEFFERRRHNGPLKHVKRPLVQRSPPMGVVYKNQPSISQDLMSLRTLQQTCDERIMNISEQSKIPSLKVPQEVNLSSKPYGSNYNMELNTSPITQPSMLELQDANSEGSMSLYDDYQPRVSTRKIGSETYESFLVPLPGKRKQFDDSSFASFEDTNCDVSLLGESVLPSITKGHLSRPPVPHHVPPTDFHSHFSDPHPPSHSLSKYTLMSGHSELPIVKERVSKRPSLPQPRKRLVDTERPLIVVDDNNRKKEKKESFNWDNIDWYGKRERLPQVKEKKKEETFKQTMPIKRKNVYDRETPFPTAQMLSLIDFHKTEQGHSKRSPPLPALDAYTLKPLDRIAPSKRIATSIQDCTKSVSVKRDCTSVSTSSVCPLLEEDPVGSSGNDPTSFVTPGSSPPVTLLCSESLSQLSDTIKSSDDSSSKNPPPSLCAFETMIRSFEKPTTEKDRNSDHDIDRPSDKKSHSFNWMNFVQGSDSKKEDKVPAQLETILEDSMSELPLVIANNKELKLCDDILLSQDAALLSQQRDNDKDTNEHLSNIELIISVESPETNISFETATALVYSSLQAHNSQTHTDNSVLCAQTVCHSTETQTDNCILHSTETQTDNSILHSTETQTDNSVLHSTETQTDNFILHSTETQTDNSILHSTETQIDDIILTGVDSPTKGNIVTAQAGTVESPYCYILQEINRFNDKIASLSGEENSEKLLSEIDSLVKEINKQKNTIMWCALMSKLKSL